MKKWVCLGAAALLALTLCGVFGKVLLTYTQPMEDTACDLSLGALASPDEGDRVYDQKGWTMFTQEGETVTELTPDGYGGFDRLAEPGQTFYFSRIMEEAVNSPALRLEPKDSSFSVFLDGELIYTDCFDLDNRIGSLRLPMGEWRPDPVVITLPEDYVGKTLTIAQSTQPSFAESDGRCWPAAVTLYNTHAGDSVLISEGFRAAIPSALAYAAGFVLLALFLWQVFQGRPDPGTLCGALAAFSYLINRVYLTGFSYLYFNLDLTVRGVPLSVWELCRDMTLLLLLVMLAYRLSGWRRIALIAATAGVSAFALGNFALAVLRQDAGILRVTWFFQWGCGVLLLALVFGFWEWNRRQWFFRCFCPLALAGTVLYALPSVLSAGPDVLSVYMVPRMLMGASLPAAFFSLVVEWLHEEVARRMEARLLLQRSQLAQSSYQVMRQQNEQVMMLRHDMMKHFQLLRQTTADEKTAAYLDELMGENQKIRPVVQSGNEMLDIILNGKLSAAADAGIAVEIVRMQAPPVLPLSDTELSSLLMNLLDNAVEAAAAPGVARPYIKLDLCIKGHFFILTCENAATAEHMQRENAPGRGLGLKIIRQIAARHENLLETEHGEDFYCVKLAIPLD